VSVHLEKTNLLFHIAAGNHNFNPATLYQVRLSVVDWQTCFDSYHNSSVGSIPSNTICAGDFKKGGVDTCQVT